MKRTISVLVLAVALAVAGVLPAQAAMKKLRFGASFSGLHHPAYATVAKHMRSEAKKHGVDIIITDSQDKLAKQVNDLEDMITKGVDVLFVNTVSKGTEPTLRKAAAKGIKVVAVQRWNSDPAVVHFVGTDNKEMGRIGAEWVVKRMKGKGNLVVMSGIPGAASSDDRKTGSDAVWAKNKGIKVVAHQTGMYNRVKALEVMENILQKNKKIDWVFCYNDSMAMGVLGAIRASGRKGINVFGMDAIKDAVQAIKRGEMTATLAIPFDEEGRVSVRNGIKLAKGEKLPKSHVIQAFVMTKSNAP